MFNLQEIYFFTILFFFTFSFYSYIIYVFFFIYGANFSFILYCPFICDKELSVDGPYWPFYLKLSNTRLWRSGSWAPALTLSALDFSRSNILSLRRHRTFFFFCLDSEWMTICTFCVAQGNNCALISSKGLHSFIRFSAYDSPWATVRRLLSLTPEYHCEFFRPPDSLLICYSLLTGSRWLSASRSHRLSVLWTLCFLMDLPPTTLSWCLRCCSFLNSLLYWSLREKSASLFPLQTGSFWSQYL